MFTRLRSFLDQWIISLQTYPIAHAIVLIMSIILMMMIEQDYDNSIMDTLVKILITGAFTLPLTIVRPGSKRWISGAVISGGLYSLALPDDIQNIVYSQSLWISGLLFLSWITPLVVLARDYKDDQYVTWSHFGHRWASFIQGRLGGLILRGGIAASLASIDFLFNVEISSSTYQHVGVITALLIGSWIWLISLQQTQEVDINQSKDLLIQTTEQVRYPRWIRIFGQYIFLPLCVIYGLILIAYGFKIITTGQRPEGQLIYMVTGYVGFGLLTWFALLPLERESSWLSKAYSALFMSFVITSGLMIGSLIIRVQRYGWTINRGLIASLITWIIVIGIGSLIWTQKKWIIGLLSLMTLGLMSIIITPLVIKNYHISQSQSLLNTAKINTEDAEKLYESLNYLADNYGTGRVGAIVTEQQTSSLSGSNRRNLARDIMNTLDITYYQNNNEINSPTEYFSFYSNQSNIIDVSGYNMLMLQLDSYNLPLGITFDKQIDKQIITISTGSIMTTIDLKPHIPNFVSKEGSPTPYIITGENYQLTLIAVNGEKNSSDTGYKVSSFGGYLLLK